MLTKNQELFCQNIVAGMSQIDAYKNAGYSLKNKEGTIYSNASRLMVDKRIVARVKELNNKIVARVIKRFSKTKEDILFEMEEIKDSEDATNKDKLDVLKEQGKLLGYYIDKVQQDITANVGIKKSL